MHILLVEDDDHKVSDLKREIEGFWSGASLDITRSVRESCMAVRGKRYDLIFLDLSLPTFDQEKRKSGGAGQPQGGIEVLRMLKRIQHDDPVIIVSQYYEVEFEKKHYSLIDCVNIIVKRYGCNLVGTVLYAFESNDWKAKIRKLMGEIK